MRYTLFLEYWRVWQGPVSILLVQRDEPECREEASRSRVHQTRRQRPRHRQSFATGLLLGAIAAGGMTRWLLDMKDRKDGQRNPNILSWPAIVRVERK